MTTNINIAYSLFCFGINPKDIESMGMRSATSLYINLKSDKVHVYRISDHMAKEPDYGQRPVKCVSKRNLDSYGLAKGMSCGSKDVAQKTLKNIQLFWNTWKEHIYDFEIDFFEKTFKTFGYSLE